jgi:formate/nitrite transporter FocA (FNT family)
MRDASGPQPPVSLDAWLPADMARRAEETGARKALFPISAFVAAGFEHCVANMYFVPVALLVKHFAPPAFWEAAGVSAADYPQLSRGRFLAGNLLPVTIGNIVGGALMVGLVYWYLYLRADRPAGEAPR